MGLKPSNERVFLLLGLLFTYPLVWEAFWWGWRGSTGVVAVCFGTYICFGMTLRFLLPRFRWVVKSVLWLSLLWTPQVLFPIPWESDSPRRWFLLAALGCIVFLLISTRRVRHNE